MVKIIETNLSMNGDKIMDHQSRVIETESWDIYVKYFLFPENNINTEFKCITNLQGRTLPRFSKIYDLEFDDYHLSCSIFNSDSMETRKLAYLALEY